MDTSNAVVVDATGTVYLAGHTRSDDFPTANAIQPARRGIGDAFIAKIAETCPADVTDKLSVFTSSFIPFLIPQLQLQLILVQNRTNEPLDGPLVFVAGAVRCDALLFSNYLTS